MLEMDMSLKEFIAGVIQSLPVSTDHFVQEFLHVLHQDLFPCVVPVGVAATFMSVLSAVFVAYRWNRPPNSKSSSGKHNKCDVFVQTEVSEGDALGTVGGKETQKTHAMKTNQRSQVSLGQLKSVVTAIWIKKLEDRLEKSDVLQKQLEKELETAKRDLETSHEQNDRKLWQKQQEMNLTTEKLKKMTEEQQSLANQRSQISLGQLKSVIMKIWINKLEDHLEKSDVLQKQLEKELETARIDLEISHQQNDRQLRQKEQEVNSITEKLKKMIEEQQNLLQESRREAESLMKEKKELEEKLTEAKKDNKKLSEAEVLQQLKAEQQKREEAEKSLQELKTELDSKNQKLKSLSEKVEILHKTMKKTEETQQVLMKELENHNNQQQKNPDPEQSAAAEEPKLENVMTLEVTSATTSDTTSDMTELRNQLEVAQAQSEALTEKNQQLEAQLAELKQRYNQEFKTIIAEEREWREELDRDVKVLRKEYENKTDQLKTIQKKGESKTSEDVSAPEEETHEEDS